MRYSKRLLTALLTIALLTGVLVSCGDNENSNNDETQTDDLPEPGPLLEESVEQIQQAQSIELEMDVRGYPVEVKGVDMDLPPEFPLMFKYARGIFQAPDRINANIQFSVGNFSTTADLIAVDREHYFRGDMLTANRWINAELIPGFSPAALMSPEIGLPHVLASITGLQMLGRTRMHGVDVFHLTGSIRASAVYALTFGLIRSKDGELQIELYIGTDDFRVAQITLTEPPPAEANEPTTWDISILNYNQSVTITPPVVEDGD